MLGQWFWGLVNLTDFEVQMYRRILPAARDLPPCWQARVICGPFSFVVNGCYF